MSDEKQPPPDDSGQGPPSQSRRRVVKAALYVPPAIIGSLVIARQALAQASCNPQSCFPNGGPCGPDQCKPRN